MRLKSVAVKGFHVFGVKEVPLRGPSLMSTVVGMDYVVFANTTSSELKQKIDDVMARDDITVERRAKKRKRRGPAFKKINLRPHIRSLTLGAPDDYAGLDERVAFQVSLDQSVTVV